MRIQLELQQLLPVDSKDQTSCSSIVKRSRGDLEILAMEWDEGRNQKDTYLGHDGILYELIDMAICIAASLPLMLGNKLCVLMELEEARSCDLTERGKDNRWDCPEAARTTE